MFECVKNEDGTHLYGGFYHIVGRIIEGPNGWIPANEGSEVVTPHYVTQYGLEIGFSKDVALVPEGFPSPVIQFEFQMNVPWLLSEQGR